MSGRNSTYRAVRNCGAASPPGPDAYISPYELETAKIEGAKALDRVSFELVKHPIIGRMVATQIRLIEEERQAAQRAEQGFRTTALSDT